MLAVLAAEITPEASIVTFEPAENSLRSNAMAMRLGPTSELRITSFSRSSSL
jgi:hypothetical protein